MDKKQTQPKGTANIINADTIKQAAIQQGSPQASQTVTITERDRENLAGIISTLLSSLEQLGLDPKQTAEVKANAEAVQALLKTDKPKESVIRQCLTTIKDTLQAAAAAIPASQLVKSLWQQISTYLGMG